jgi:hypothetical protein
MYRLIAIALITTLSGCGITSEVLIGTKVADGGFYGDSPTFTFRARKAVTWRTFVEYEHVSHLLVGPPLGPTSAEDSLDQISYGIRFGEAP